MAFDSTVAGENANSYVSVADADAYFLTVFGGAAWAPLDSAVKEALLMEATRLLDLYYNWIGSRATETQRLGWPRANATYPDSRAIPEDVIPEAVKYATYDLAFHVNANSGFTMLDNTIDSVKVGPISVDFLDNKSPSSIPKAILTYLASYGYSSIPVPGGIHQVRLVRT